jgi:hypothetical protein
MSSNRSDLADLAYFLAIARHRNFRRAGLELGVSASALSHSLKGLEARLGVRLLNRTNRSVTLTAAGEVLRAEINGPSLSRRRSSMIFLHHRYFSTLGLLGLMSPHGVRASLRGRRWAAS